jgi:hypothetical protein
LVVERVSLLNLALYLVAFEMLVVVVWAVGLALFSSLLLKTL